MFTTCPSCRMNLAVTVLDLRVGQGYVRCGRCDRVFNALLSLSDDVEPDDQSGLAATGTTTVPALSHDVADGPSVEVTETPTPELEAVAEPPADAEPAAPAPQASDPAVDVVDTQGTGTFETIVLEGDGYLQTEEHVDEQELEEQLQEIARQIDQLERTAPEAGESDATETPTEVPEYELSELEAEAAVGNPRRAHWAWVAAAVLLTLALAGQVMHHERQSLVSHPLLERPLQRLYGLFGANLEPAWDLGAYDLRQLGGEAMPGTSTTIVLRATVHNRSASRQPPPMIRAVLQDRFGNDISSTAIAPAEYLRGEAPARLAPDQRVDAELRLSDPNRQAVGFSLDACLPGSDNQLHCSTGP